MAEEKQAQDSTTESSVRAAAKTGKAVASIAKGAATGGVHGAALSAANESKKWLVAAIIGSLALPILMVAMLPSIIFGSLLSDGSDSPNGITDDEALTQRLVDLNTGISTVLSEGLTDVLDRIDANFNASGCDEKEINNPYGSDVVFNANYFIAMYCASRDNDIEGISQSDMENVLRAGKAHLYSFTYTDEQRVVDTGEVDEETGEAIETTITIRLYSVVYNGESYFADQIFALTDDQKSLSGYYARNLSVLLSDGVYQSLSSTEFSAMGVSYDGVVFTDGSTQVVYYNQLDERWKNAAYGTDNIGGYACGPTSMSIVVSSLTSDTVDPEHMAQWAYENGYWCSGSGSYHSLIPGAAEAWGLNVEGCKANEPQRIVDALASGKLVVAIMVKGHFTSSGHFIVLRGVTAEGKILVADPASYQRSGQEWDLSIILDEASKHAGAGGPFWIIGN